MNPSPTTYAHLLISYEFALSQRTQTTLEAIEPFPTTPFIGHSHDSNVVIVAADERERFMAFISQRAKGR
jgi:hypothetical protein